jgi:hypothetical protein
LGVWECSSIGIEGLLLSRCAEALHQLHFLYISSKSTKRGEVEIQPLKLLSSNSSILGMIMSDVAF